ncbi:MAG: permease [Planctomycetota bacterium]|nr:MAG: permease [Planctomycetota bacterium]
MAFGKAEALPFREGAVADVGVEERAAFLLRTYAHLAGAVFFWVFFMVLIELALPTATKERLLVGMLGGISWLVVLGAFMLVSFVANRWAMSDASVGLQYLGLGLYAAAEAVITWPLVHLAAFYAKDPNVLPAAAGLTLAMFAGLTTVVFVTRKDFSFLRGVLGVAGLAALGLIVASIVFGFTLGIVFTVAMIGLMCGYILYYTSNVLHYYRPNQHVAAALALFAALATLFWYVLQLLMSLQSRD